ncbi:LysE family translocator [Streptomyces sp. NPDC088752]|uniref:LysE family translocator n=1 Tax=Streptomyces sp. NPDC088752 TaxID=3154963 RepID=UPI00343B3FBB
MSLFFCLSSKRSTACSRTRSLAALPALPASANPPPCAYLTVQGYRSGPAAVRRTGPTPSNQVQYLVAAAAGLSALFAAVPLAFTVVKLAGATYLAYLAWEMLKHGGRSPFASARDLPPVSDARLFSTGLLTNLLNPKIALMYAALLPQFMDPQAGPDWAQLLQLGAVQIAVGITVNGLIMLGAARVSGFLATRPRVMTAQRFTAGGLLGFFALRTALTRTPVSA